MGSRFAKKVRDLERRVLEQPGALEPEIRRAAARGEGVPPDAAAYVDKVRRHAYLVTDDDVDALRSAGYSEDQIFEITVAAAYGAGAERLQAGLDALGGPPPVSANIPGEGDA
jgi:alkylhydroperoxidase family enzyme